MPPAPPPPHPPPTKKITNSCSARASSVTWLHHWYSHTIIPLHKLSLFHYCCEYTHCSAFSCVYSYLLSKCASTFPGLPYALLFRGAEQCCINEAGLGGMVPWVRCLQGTGVVFKLYRLPVPEPADQIRTNKEDNWTGIKYTYTVQYCRSIHTMYLSCNIHCLSIV